jgi:alpha-L-arabinofuranosidase
VNTIKIDPERELAPLSRDVFGGFIEHLGRGIYGGLYDEGSPLADERGFRLDVLSALRPLRMPLVRYPGGNFVSGYRWMDGIGPREQRPARQDLAWGVEDSNRFGTDEFMQWCRALGTEPYLAVNCGDGDMREARDWVEYCNGTGNTALANLRRRHGAEAPYRVRYWGIGNEVDGPWQIGMKTPQEYARAYTEFAKVMRWVDKEILLVAAWTSGWFDDWVERGQLLLEQAPDLVDYLAIHWYVDNRKRDYARYMALSEMFEERLTAVEGLIAAMRCCRKIARPVYLSVDEWGIGPSAPHEGIEGYYRLEDAQMVALQLNAFIRHARSVRMACLAQIVNVIAPVLTRPDGLLLQAIYHPLALYCQQAGDLALDIAWAGETFQGGEKAGVRVLDVAGTLDNATEEVTLFVVNRSPDQSVEAAISLQEGLFRGEGTATVVNGSDPNAISTFAEPEAVWTVARPLLAQGRELVYAFEPHSVTALRLQIA